MRERMNACSVSELTRTATSGGHCWGRPSGRYPLAQGLAAWARGRRVTRGTAGVGTEPSHLEALCRRG